MPMTLLLTGADGSQRPVAVPVTWSDVTLGQLRQLRTEPTTPRLCILTDLTPEELSRIAPSDLLYFSNCLDFMSDQHLLADMLTLLLADLRG